MSTTITKLRIALVAAACAIPSMAQAKAHRLVILDFDGPQADSSRMLLLSSLGREYEVVPTDQWTAARVDAENKTQGPAVWETAARKAKVDAVISGWVQPDGKHTSLTVKAVAAATGTQIFVTSVNVDKGLSSENTRKLVTDLDVELAALAPPPAPVATIVVPTLGIGGEIPKDTPADKAAKADDCVNDPNDPKDCKAKAPVVAAAEPQRFLQQDQVLVTIDNDHRDVTVSRPTPRFAIDAGLFYGTRSMTLTADNPDLVQYPGNPQQGVQITASVYPWPTQKRDGQLSGFGASFTIGRSIGSSVSFEDEDGYGEYVVQTTNWEAGLHYRWPFAMGAVDASVTYGNQSLAIEDAPLTLETPDTSYTYVGVGGHVDLKVTDRASVGFGAHYLIVTDAGDAVSTDWYGPGNASGLALDADFIIPLPSNLYLRGDIKYTRFQIDYVGVGGQFDDEGVQSSTDTTVQASANVGVWF